MTDPNVSPLPWAWTYDGSSDFSIGPADDPQANSVANVYSWGRDDETAMAHCDLIVRAVNSHERLVAAAEDALSMCRYLQQSPEEERPYGVGIDRVADKCRAALAAAKEGA